METQGGNRKVGLLMPQGVGAAEQVGLAVMATGNAHWLEFFNGKTGRPAEQVVQGEFGQSPAPLMLAAAEEALSQANKSSPGPAAPVAAVPAPWMATQLPVRMAWAAVVAVLAVTTAAAMVALAPSSSATPRAQ
jgi:hypothetical protein